MLEILGMTQRDNNMKNVLFVCTGNTCRSPIAKGLFDLYSKRFKISETIADCAGLAANLGNKPEPNAVCAASIMGADISPIRSKQINPSLANWADIIVCMTKEHLYALTPYVPFDNLYLLSDGINDPYGKDVVEYKKCAIEIAKALMKLIEDKILLEIVALADKHIIEIEKIEQKSFSDPWTVQSFASELLNPNSRFFVAEYDKKPVGYAVANNILGEVYITNIAVKTEYRKRGIARALLDKLIKTSIEEKAKLLTLEVRISNSIAINFYEREGFVICGQRKDFYENPKENAYIMTLKL